MGYSSNGTEGMDYEEAHCLKCIHSPTFRGCPVWEAHMLWNYDEFNKPDSILHKMIPRAKLGNERCIFWYERKDGA